MARSHVFAGVGGYYGGNQGNLAGVFRLDADGADWTHVLTEPEAYTVFVHPRDPDLVLAGTKDGIYRSTDGGATFKRAGLSRQRHSNLVVPAGPRRSKTNARRRLAGFDLSQQRRRRDMDMASRSETAGSRQGAIRGAGDAYCTTSEQAG